MVLSDTDDLQESRDALNNLQQFFVLHKASPQKPERKSSGKRRRIELPSSLPKSLEKPETETVEGLVYNEQLFENLRMEAFDYVWSKTDSAIKDVLRKINVDVFNKIDGWVHESFNAISSHGMPDFAKVTCAYPIITDATSNQLFTGLVFTRNIEFVDDLLTFADLGQHLRSHGCHVANLSSLDFSVKNGISGSLRNLLRKFLMVSLDAADISVLTSWYAEQGIYEKPLVVIIEDLERCCGAVLSDFILLLSEWVVKIPIILIIGVATTVDAPRNILSSNALQCLSPCKFILESPADKLDAIIAAVLVRQCSGFSVGHKVANFLRNCFLRQDGTVSSYVRALKMAIVQHFSMEPLSFMLKGLLYEEDRQILWSGKHEAQREVMLKQAFNLPSYTRNKLAVPNGEVWDQGLSEIKRLQKLWSSVLLCLYEAGQCHNISLLDLYCESLDPDLYDSRASEIHSVLENNFRMPSSNQNVLGRHHDSHIGGFICQAIRKVRDLSPAALSQLVEKWVTLSEGINEIHEKLNELWRELTDMSRRHTTRNKLTTERDAKVLNKKAAALIGCFVRDYMQPIERVTFHEIVCFKNVDKLQSVAFCIILKFRCLSDTASILQALIGDPRKRIQADLLESFKFLKCSCCKKSGLLPSMHDTSVMYVLAQEHGDLINLHDWYQSFKANICPTTNKVKSRLKQSSPSPKKRKDVAIEQPPRQSEASLQARFCRAIIELQITGLLRMPSKRRPDYVQRVAFGL